MLPALRPVVMMIENYCSGFLGRLMQRCPAIRLGLQRAGFGGGRFQPGCPMPPAPTA